jgi:hypothetical protein
MFGARRGRPSLIGTAARTAVITKTATSVAGSSAAKQQARAHQAELAHAERLAAVGPGQAASWPKPEGGDPVLNTADSLDAFRKLSAAHDAGIVTDAEFVAKVKERLG